MQVGADRPGQRGRVAARLVAVADAEPAAAIHFLHRQSGCPQFTHQPGDARVGGAVRGSRKNLAADMHRQSDGADARQRGGAGIQSGHVRIRDAELVPRPPGADLGVSAGIDVRIDPQRDPRGPPRRLGQDREHLQFLGAFDVDLTDVLIQGQTQLVRGLADA